MCIHLTSTMEGLKMEALILPFQDTQGLPAPVRVSEREVVVGLLGFWVVVVCVAVWVLCVRSLGLVQVTCLVL